jgi:hypothetical protein
MWPSQIADVPEFGRTTSAQQKVFVVSPRRTSHEKV